MRCSAQPTARRTTSRRRSRRGLPSAPWTSSTRHGHSWRSSRPSRGPGARQGNARGRHKLWIGAYLLALVALGALHYAVRLEFFDFADAYRPPVLRAVTGAIAVVLVLAAREDQVHADNAQRIQARQAASVSASSRPPV